MRTLLLAIGLSVPLSVPMLAGEVVLFASGQQLSADRHERSGDTIVLYRGAGVVHVPASSVAGIESDGRVAEPAPAAQVAATVVPPAPSPVSTNPRSTNPRDIIREAAERAGLPATFVESVARVESAFRTDAISPKGAIGVMQLMPATAQALGADPHDVRQNIEAGTRLLRDLLLKYNGDAVKALAAYNAGEGAVARYGGVPPYDETLHYVNKVITAYQKAEAGKAD